MDELIAELRAARARTRQVADDLGAEREFGPKLAIVNPPRWEVGHVGWFQEYWCLRGAPEARSILPNADALYNSATVPHDDRWSLPLPSFERTLEYRDAVLDRVIRKVQRGDGDAYFVRLAARHEEMHAEAFHYTRQTLGYPAPRGLAQGPGSVTHRSDVELPGGVFRLGAAPGKRFTFDNEKWSHPVVLQPFRIARNPVTNAEFREFIEHTRRPVPAYWRNGELRRFDRWIPIPGDEPVMHVNWHDAEAYCRFAGRRLPIEAEWECAAMAGAINTGQVWEWTASTFLPYPGFLRDPYQEYSEPWFGTHKVLRGASFATPAQVSHARFRNFYTPERADIFAGFRTCAA